MMRLLIASLVVACVLAQCTNPEPGTRTVTVEVAGQGARSFVWFVPQGLAPTQPIPGTVFGWHGLGGNGQQFANAGNWPGALQAQLWQGVFPDGAGGCHNGGGCCFCGQDDIAFTRAMIEFITTNACVDTNRIFSSGFSNGGFMSHRLGCQMPEVFAAIGPHAGVKSYGNSFTACNTEFPVAILHSHGTSDGTIPYNGNGLFGWPAVETNRDEFMNTFFTCSPRVEMQISPSTVCTRTEICTRNGGLPFAVPLEWCRSEGLGHTWTTVQGQHPALVPLFMNFFTTVPVVPRPDPLNSCKGYLDTSVEPIISPTGDEVVQQAMRELMMEQYEELY